MSLGDRHTSVWQRLERSLNHRIARLQLQLEQVGLPEDISNAVRGQIQECRHLLSFPYAPEAEARSSTTPLD